MTISDASSGVITALVQEKRPPFRVRVFIDGDCAFTVSLGEAAALNAGQVLDPAIQAAHRRAESLYLARKRALRLLASRPKSSEELRRQLSAKGFAPDVVASVLGWLDQNGYTDDRGFARQWVESRRRTRPRSAFALGFELRAKGVADAHIQEALAGYDDSAAAWAAIRRRLPGWQGLENDLLRKKVTGFLRCRGFDYPVIVEVLKWVLKTMAEKTY
jgi:regulatory protein